MAKKLPCGTCGVLRWPIRAGVPIAACHECRRSRPTYQRPGPKPIETWACARCGVSCSRPATRGQRPSYCESCQTRGWISRTRRFAIYDRDGWVCWLCEEPVDRSLVGSRSPWRPSLDHVVPRSRGGDDSTDNLKLSHQWCNAVRGDGRVHDVEVFRVSA